MYGYPRGASLIVTVSPLWLFSWSLCYWTKMVFLCYFDHGKWCGKEKPITLPNGRTHWCTDSNTSATTGRSATSPPLGLSLSPPAGPWRGASGPDSQTPFQGDNVMLEVINIGNVPVMGVIVPSNRKGTMCFHGPDSCDDWSLAGRLYEAKINK